MGQYYQIVNLDKQQFLNPHAFGEGLKLLEFGLSGGGTMAALAILLADGNGRGGGDLDSRKRIIGSWAGDRIVVAGDYADEDSYGIKGTLYAACEKRPFKDVSARAWMALLDDPYFRQDAADNYHGEYGVWMKGMLKKNYPKVAALLNKIAPSAKPQSTAGKEMRPDMVIGLNP